MSELNTTFKNDMTHYICPACSDTHWTEDAAKTCCVEKPEDAE